MNESKDFARFRRACEHQWKVGGERYALADMKEVSDLLYDFVGEKWFGGLIAKYACELVNCRIFGAPMAEASFFKIVVYGFLWWLRLFNESTYPALKENTWPRWAERIYVQWVKAYKDKGNVSVDYNTFLHKVIATIAVGEVNIVAKTFLIKDISALAYQWWLQEVDNLTSIDRGEEFEDPTEYDSIHEGDK